MVPDEESLANIEPDELNDLLSQHYNLSLALGYDDDEDTGVLSSQTSSQASSRASFYQSGSRASSRDSSYQSPSPSFFLGASPRTAARGWGPPAIWFPGFFPGLFLPVSIYYPFFLSASPRTAARALGAARQGSLRDNLVFNALRCLRTGRASTRLLRDFELGNPPWEQDLQSLAVQEEDHLLLKRFWTALETEQMEYCHRCREQWFDMCLKDGICKRCISRDKIRRPDEPYFFSHENRLDFGVVPAHLPQLTQVEEMLIARVYVFVNIMQIRGQQHLYRGHVVHFLRDVGKVYNQLPLLPTELDIILLKPKNTTGSEHLQQQFRRQFRIRRSHVKQWLDWLKAMHPGYRDVIISQQRLEALPYNSDVMQNITVQEIDAIEVGEEDIEAVATNYNDPEQGAVPDVLFHETEAQALEGQLFGVPPESPTTVTIVTQQ